MAAPVGATAAPASVIAEQAPVAAGTSTDTIQPAACTAYPSAGWVFFYQNTNCGGRYQGMSRCGTQPFIGVLYRQASSYIDAQTGGAYALVYEGANTLVFRTYPNTGVRNVAVWENDRSEWANLVC
jgi:hypothetical protein